MDTSPRIVLAETDPARFLRFVLEGEGLPMIGLASSDDELRRVLRGVRPAVVVIDAGISAATALEVREDHPDASVVVVWPSGIAAVLAHEHVEPDRVVEDLGDAVRRGLARADRREVEHRQELEQVGIPPHLRLLLAGRDEDEDPTPATPARPEPEPTSLTPLRRTRRAVALTAAVWILTLALATAMAATAPSAFNFFRGFARPTQEGTATITATPPSARTSLAPAEDERGPASGPQSDDAQTRDDRGCEVSTDRSDDRRPSAERGCSDDHRQDDGKGSSRGGDPDHGKPEGTPGRGKPEETGKPEGTGKPEAQGKPDRTGKPDAPGTHAAKGRPVSGPTVGGRSATGSERPRR